MPLVRHYDIYKVFLSYRSFTFKLSLYRYYQIILLCIHFVMMYLFYDVYYLCQGRSGLASVWDFWKGRPTKQETSFEIVSLQS